MVKGLTILLLMPVTQPRLSTTNTFKRTFLLPCRRSIIMEYILQDPFQTATRSSIHYMLPHQVQEFTKSSAIIWQTHPLPPPSLLSPTTIVATAFNIKDHILSKTVMMMCISETQMKLHVSIPWCKKWLLNTGFLYKILVTRIQLVII